MSLSLVKFGAVLFSVLLLAGCLPDPHRLQIVDLLERLASARVQFADPSRTDDACEVVGEVQTRLFGEPGLSGVQPAWSALLHAADALQAVCGLSTMLAQPANESPAMVQAHQRWQDGIQRETGVACDHLRVAASALGRASPC